MATRELPSRLRRLTAVVVASAITVLGVPASAGAKVSYVPIPEFITDPNEGNTFGIMGVALILDDETDELRYMVAPDIRYNETKGVFPTFRLFGYPSVTREYTIAVGKSTTKDETYEVEFHEAGLLGGKAFVDAFGLYERDSTERFYGFGNFSHESAESNYTAADFQSWVQPAYMVLPHLAASWRIGLRHFEVQRGQVDSDEVIDLVLCFDRPHPTRLCPPDRRSQRLPDARPTDFDPQFYVTNRFALTYDTRDLADIPTRGAYSNLYAEVADEGLGSAHSYWKFGAEWRGYVPFRTSKNPVLALRALADYTSGDKDIPFWQLNDLGGRRRLRGFGSDRFIDYNRTLLAAELRTRVWQRKLFGVNAELELAPFFEAGQVFRRVSDSPVNKLHWIGGLGFRGVVAPQIVAFVDVGRSTEGLAVFTGINYPF